MGLTTHRVFTWVDFVVSGEAETLITPLCKAILSSGSALKTSQIPLGVFAPLHRAEGYPQPRDNRGGQRALVSNMDEVPAPNYEDYFETLNCSPSRRWITPALLLESARGCWWGQKVHCTFCGLNGESMTFRSKNPDIVFQEIIDITRRYNIRKVEMVDNILDQRYFKSLFPRLESVPDRLSIFYEVKANLKREQIAQLVRAGVTAVQPGIESLDTRVLRLLNKGVSCWQNIRLLKWARQYGLSVQWSSIIGTPQEEDRWYVEAGNLLPAIFHLQPGGCHHLRYDRFSPYHQRQAQYGLRLVPYPEYKEVYGLDEATVADLVYFFVDAASSEDSCEDWDFKQAGTGVQRFAGICRYWRDSWKKPPRPVCTLVETAAGVYLHDTRPHFMGGVRQISALADRLLQLTDEGIPISELWNQPGLKQEFSEADIRNQVQELVRAGVILLVDGRALSVALRAPVTPLQLRNMPFGQTEPPTQSVNAF
jgi:ribosomal peptide maturation radical SAM protein 1